MENFFKFLDGKYDLSRVNRENYVDKKECELLIKESLDNLPYKVEYELFGNVFNYGLGEFEVGTHYGFDICDKNGICIIFSTQRDIAYPVSIFPLNRINQASDYFIWLVKNTNRKTRC